MSDDESDAAHGELLPAESRRKLLNFATHPVTKFLTKLAGGARGEAVTQLFEGLHDREAENEGAC